MNGPLDGLGFLGTRAPFRSDIALVLILFSMALFTCGWILARRKHYTAHRWVQTTAAILNATVVLSLMVNVFRVYILPGIPNKLTQGDYLFSTLHALVGFIATLFGIFVVLRGNGLVPKSLRFNNYKLFMRTSYALYMLATLLGIFVYILVYVYGI